MSQASHEQRIFEKNMLYASTRNLSIGSNRGSSEASWEGTDPGDEDDGTIMGDEFKTATSHFREEQIILMDNDNDNDNLSGDWKFDSKLKFRTDTDSAQINRKFKISNPTEDSLCENVSLAGSTIAISSSSSTSNRNRDAATPILMMHSNNDHQLQHAIKSQTNPCSNYITKNIENNFVKISQSPTSACHNDDAQSHTSSLGSAGQSQKYGQGQWEPISERTIQQLHTQLSQFQGGLGGLPGSERRQWMDVYRVSPSNDSGSESNSVATSLVVEVESVDGDGSYVGYGGSSESEAGADRDAEEDGDTVSNATASLDYVRLGACRGGSSSRSGRLKSRARERENTGLPTSMRRFPGTDTTSVSGGCGSAGNTTVGEELGEGEEEDGGYDGDAASDCHSDRGSGEAAFPGRGRGLGHGHIGASLAGRGRGSGERSSGKSSSDYNMSMDDGEAGYDQEHDCHSRSTVAPSISGGGESGSRCQSPSTSVSSSVRTVQTTVNNRIHWHGHGHGRSLSSQSQALRHNSWTSLPRHPYMTSQKQLLSQKQPIPPLPKLLPHSNPIQPQFPPPAVEQPYDNMNSDSKFSINSARSSASSGEPPSPISSSSLQLLHNQSVISFPPVTLSAAKAPTTYLTLLEKRERSGEASPYPDPSFSWKINSHSPVAWIGSMDTPDPAVAAGTDVAIAMQTGESNNGSNETLSQLRRVKRRYNEAENNRDHNYSTVTD